MKKILTSFLLASLACAGTAFALFNTTWQIAPDYSIKFSGKKAEGTFSGLTGKVRFHPGDLAGSAIDVLVMANSIQTGNDLKDKHARGEDWLDVIQFPIIRFTSTRFTSSGTGFQVAGVLDLHGVKKNVQIPFSFAEANNSATFTGSFTIRRTDFGIKGNVFGFTVGDDLELTLKIPVTRL